VPPEPQSTPGPELLRLGVLAMATRFELVLPRNPSGLPEESLRAAGEAALAEIVEAESWLSIYRPDSPLAEINARAAREPVRVSPPIFALLEQAREWSRRTAGAFDPTVGPLVQLWRDLEPLAEAWNSRAAAARSVIGWSHVELDARSSTVRFDHPAVRLDLGSMGKGWALDRATEVLRDAGVTCALLHGGTSTLVAIGSAPDKPGWPIELAAGESGEAGEAGDGSSARTVVFLRDESLSVSATWGRLHRDAGGRMQGHVLDPRHGLPVAGPARAAVAGPSAAATDVLSTALLVSGDEFLANLPLLAVGYRGWRD